MASPVAVDYAASDGGIPRLAKVGTPGARAFDYWPDVVVAVVDEAESGTIEGDWPGSMITVLVDVAALPAASVAT